jgi:hypothetical protein
MGNSESRPAPNSNVEKNLEQWHNAVNGNTEHLVSSPQPIPRAALLSTSEGPEFTESERLVPVPLPSSNAIKHTVHENMTTIKPSGEHTDLVGGAFDLSYIFNK